MTVPVVTLREITRETVRGICDLAVAPGQQGMVAPNAVSIAEAHYEPKAWCRAIYADEEPVGFIMLLDDPDTPRYYLWRLMIDARHQGRGFGKEAVLQLIDHVRTRPGATQLTVSWVPGDGGPAAFYEKLGFVATDRIEHGEVEGRLVLGGRPR